MIELRMNGLDVQVEEGSTLLDVARYYGIEIPTLCHHDGLSPYGACRLCVVEIGEGDNTKLVSSCTYPAQAGLNFKTHSKRVVEARKILVELLLAMCPSSKTIQDLASAMEVKKVRFNVEYNDCILCGLCVRYCTEVKKKNAIGFIDRGVRREVMFIPEIASKECWDCKECFPLCPTSALQATFVLTGALTSFSPSHEPGLD